MLSINVSVTDPSDSMALRGLEVGNLTNWEMVGWIKSLLLKP